jgi:hypothetical protein
MRSASFDWSLQSLTNEGDPGREQLGIAEGSQDSRRLGSPMLLPLPVELTFTFSSPRNALFCSPHQ